MTAFVKLGHEPDAAELREVDMPLPGAGDVLVRVSRTGICGSDVRAVNSAGSFRWLATPIVLGHEVVGVVEETGSAVRTVEAGHAVALVSLTGCEACPTCVIGQTQQCPSRRALGFTNDGGLAELVAVPERQVVPLPDGLPIDEAVLVEPLSVAVRATLSHGEITPGDRVVVSGPGPIGLFCARLAQLAGAEVTVLGAPSDQAARLPFAGRAGIDTLVSEGMDAASLPERLGMAPDVWIEASGAAPALRLALDGIRPGGQVVVVAIGHDELTVSPTDLVRRELRWRFSYGSTKPDYLRAITVLSTHPFLPSGLVDKFPLDAVGDALAAAEAGTSIKPVVVIGE